MYKVVKDRCSEHYTFMCFEMNIVKIFQLLASSPSKTQGDTGDQHKKKKVIPALSPQ